MTLPLWCLFFSAVLIFLAKIPVAKAMATEGGGRYDNHHPRAQQARLTGSVRVPWRRTRTASRLFHCSPRACWSRM